jgi:hypothetical protein
VFAYASFSHGAPMLATPQKWCEPLPPLACHIYTLNKKFAALVTIEIGVRESHVAPRTSHRHSHHDLRCCCSRLHHHNQHHNFSRTIGDRVFVVVAVAHVSQSFHAASCQHQQQRYYRLAQCIDGGVGIVLRFAPSCAQLGHPHGEHHDVSLPRDLCATASLDYHHFHGTLIAGGICFGCL